MSQPEPTVIVVGVDGSRNSRAALTWAAGEAEFRHSELVALIAWTTPAPAVGATSRSLRIADAARYETMAKQTVEATVADELGDRVDVTCKAIRGPAARTLITAGRQAEMLVVGARGSGGFAGLRFGSVSEQVVRHAPCPVLVVPATRPAAERSRRKKGPHRPTSSR